MTAGALPPFDGRRRSPAAERMDDPALPFDAYRAVLTDLARINRLSFGYRPTLRWLAGVVGRGRHQRLRLLDVGFGQGDMLRRIAVWGRAKGADLELVGIDRHPWAVRVAAAATPPDLAIAWRTADLTDLGAERFDLVISALVAHHLTDAELVGFLAWMDGHATVGWLVNDLHRHWLAYHGARLGGWVFGCHPVCRHDAPVSVARALTAAEWRRRLAEAGVAGRIRWHLPFRFAVSGGAA